MDELTQKLFKACEENADIEVIRELIKKGAKANYENYKPGTWGASSRSSPLHFVLKQKEVNIDVVKLLLESGANPEAKYEDYNWKGGGGSETAFQMALPLIYNNLDLLFLFLKHGANPNTAMQSEAHTMRYDGSRQWRPLHNAVKKQNVDVVRIFLEHGAQADAPKTERGQSEYGSGEDTDETSLHMICKDKNQKALEIAELLISKGANVNRIRKYLDNVHINVTQTVTDPRSMGYVPSVKLVQQRETPLHIAVKEKNVDMVWLLVSRGADLSIRYLYGKESKSVYDLCDGNPDLLEALNYVWTPKNHKRFQKPVRDAIKYLLLIAKKQNWKFDNQIMYKIFNYVAFGWKKQLN